MSPAERSRNLWYLPRLRHEPIKPHFGSRVLNTKAELFSGHLAKAIRELFEQRGVLVFADLQLSDEEQVAFATTLGASHAKRRRGPRAAVGEPTSLARLSRKRLPSWDGSAGFCNTYAAWESQTEAEMAPKPLRAMHSAWTSLFFYEPDARPARQTDSASVTHQELPMVRLQRVGYPSLLSRRIADHVVSLHATQLDQILIELRAWASGEEFSYRHDWRVDELVMWGRL